MHPPELSALTWPEADHDLVIVPLGSLEQHGPHLPLGTDTAVAAAVSVRLGERARAAGIRATVAPAVPYGASGEHEGFPGTVSIGTEALTHVLIELGRSLSRWAPRIVVVNGHGGNVDALRQAVTTLRAEGRDVSWIACAPGPRMPPADAHAGRHETSLLLHLGARVREDLAEAGDRRPLSEILPALREGGVRAVASNGVLGDPAGADAAEGARLLESIGARAWAALGTEAIAPDGRRTGGEG